MKPTAPTPHPTSEDWAGWLYEELSPDRQRELDRHLAGCAECQTAVGQWRAAMQTLDAWQLPAPVRHRTAETTWLPRLKWAAAALVILGAGLVAGRLTVAPPDLAQLRAALVPGLRDELRREFQAELQTAVNAATAQTDRKIEDLAAAWSASRQQDQQSTLALFSRTERQRQAELAWMRRDLETVALVADERLGVTQRTLGQLIAAAQPVSNP